MARPKGSKNKEKATVTPEEVKTPENLIDEIIVPKEEAAPIPLEDVLEEVTEEQEEEMHEVVYFETGVKNAFYMYMRGNDPQVIGRAWEKFKQHLN